MDSALEFLTRREIVVGLAVLGAVVAMLGALLRSRARKPWADRLVYAGYGLTAASVILFIVAGFRA